MEDGGKSPESQEGHVVAHPDRSPDGEAGSVFSDLVQLRREENETSRHALQFAENSDQRQYDFHCKRIEAEERQNKLIVEADERSNNRAFRLIGGAGLAFTLLIAGLFYMLFHGDKGQSSMAMNLLSGGLKAFGGGGIIVLFAAAVQRLMRRR